MFRADGKRMAEAILRLYDDPTRGDQMRRKAYHYTQGVHCHALCLSAVCACAHRLPALLASLPEFRWSLIAQKYLELMKAVVK